jgi:hypothetical protein
VNENGAGAGLYGRVRNITSDALGNSYIAGEYLQSINIDGWTQNCVENFKCGPDSTCNESQCYGNIMIKLNPLGKVLWIKTLGATSFSTIRNDIVSDTYGNIYFYGGVSNVNSVEGDTIVANGYNEDIYMARADTSTGTVKWLFVTGGKADESPINFSSDGAGNFYLSGYMGSPGASDTSFFGPLKISNRGGGRSLFIVKLFQPAPVAEKEVITEFLIYPNPARDNLKVRIGEGFGAHNLYLINSLGVVVFSCKISDGENELLLPPLASGIYFTEIEGAHQKVHSKLCIE